MTFPLAGNGAVAAALSGLLAEKRLPHAIIIEGEQGLGKKTLADFIASAAVCSGDSIPCGECRHCKNAKDRCHPDIIYILPEDKKKSITVGQIREMREEVFVKAHSANRKVFIINPADSMNPSSQNALLKVLEEPPAGVMFILVCESKAALLQTVISRCITLSLSCPQREVAVKHIARTSDYSEDAIFSALADANNNIGRALRLLAGKETAKTEKAAEEFIARFLEDDLYGMLLSLKSFEKNRPEADRLFKALKLLTAKKTREASGSAAKRFSRLYSLFCEAEKSLATNINLGLLFCRITAAAAEIGKLI